jgi:hypothetical protein
LITERQLERDFPCTRTQESCHPLLDRIALRQAECLPKPQQRVGEITLVHQPGAVGDIQAHQAFTALRLAFGRPGASFLGGLSLLGLSRLCLPRLVGIGLFKRKDTLKWYIFGAKAVVQTTENVT